jgi:ketosteroid isomerase-like protein
VRNSAIIRPVRWYISAAAYTSYQGNTILNQSSLEKEVRAIEDEWTTAFERTDVATLDRLMSDSYVLTTTFGRTLTKAQTLDMIRSGDLKVFMSRLSDINIRLFNDVAVVIGLSTMKAKFGDDDVSGEFRFTDVMMKRRGRWMLVAAHGSKVMPSSDPLPAASS